MAIRLHPATTHGDRIHKLGSMFMNIPIAATVCGITFAWGNWKDRSHGSLPLCERCW